jgi:hypothetical protein
VAVREASDLVFEVADTQQFAQLETRVVEAQCLIEVRCEEKMFRRSRFHKLLQSTGPSLRATYRDAAKLTVAMRQKGEGDHAEALKFSDPPVNWGSLRHRRAVAGRLRDCGAPQSIR